ncbi:MAG: heavy metal-responsive transcriptional regulator [Myxococcales bacterium]|nr:heavy metal-responsive transcriptional regulator [Myxococcales bacterium]
MHSSKQKKEDNHLLRKEVSRLSGVGSETLLYYEKIGIIPRPPRSRSGYRHYPPEILGRLRFVLAAKSLGFSLDEIRELLSWRDEKERPCKEVQERALQKMQEIEQKINDLFTIRQELSRLIELCSGDGITEGCVILRSLAQETSPHEEKEQHCCSSHPKPSS